MSSPMNDALTVGDAMAHVLSRLARQPGVDERDRATVRDLLRRWDELWGSQPPAEPREG